MDSPSRPQPPATPAQLLLIIGGGAFALIVGILAAIYFLMTNSGALAERLVSDTHALVGTPRRRPSHAIPPLPGSFADSLPELISQFEVLPDAETEGPICPDPEARSDDESDAGLELLDLLQEQCMEATRGELPLAIMPKACLVELEENRGVLHQILAATRAETGGLPADVGSLVRPQPGDTSGMNLLFRAVELATLEVRVLHAVGRTEDAVDTCLDALALTRELSLSGGMFGLRLSAEGQELLYHPCAEALDAASLERKRLALEQLARLRRGTPSLAAILREESVYEQLQTVGDLLFAESIATLPEPAQELSGQIGTLMFHDPLAGGGPLRHYIWRRHVAGFDALMAAAELPSAERAAAFRSIAARHHVVGKLWDPSEYIARADAFDRQRIQALALAALVEVDLARAEQRDWPTSLSPEFERSVSLLADSTHHALLVPHGAGFDTQKDGLHLTADAMPLCQEHPICEPR